MRITRETHIAAPPGHAVHAFGPCYTGPQGRRLVESVAHYAFDGRYYFAARLYRRVSEDNGRTWTADTPLLTAERARSHAREMLAPRHFFDVSQNALLAFHSDWQMQTDEPQFESLTASQSYRVYTALSRDEGRTWSAPQPVIHHGPGYTADHWLPGVTYGQNGACVESSSIVRLPDGTLVVGLVSEPADATGALIRPHGGYFMQVAFLRGRWNADSTALAWELSDYLRVPPERSSVGCCEPDLVSLGGQRLFTTLRCQGLPDRRIPSARYGAVSEDGGRTWSAPQPLRYDDGEPVHVPASYAAFLTSPRTGRIWWFANILDHPVYAQYPRCPLAMVELDPARLCLVRSSVRVVQDLPPGAPPCTNALPAQDEECGRQYTNFGYYTDRDTGEMVLLVPEMPKTSWKDFTSDCVRIRIAD